jgi:hypothetical protein
VNRRPKSALAQSENAERAPQAAQFPSNAVWLNTAQAAAYTGRPTRAAFREWARRHGVVAAGGRVSRLDIDAAFERIRVRRTAAIGLRSKHRLRRVG